MNIVAHLGLDSKEVYGSNPPQRKVKAGDFVATDDGRILHVVSNGQRLRYGVAWWPSWEAFKAQNEWVQQAIDDKERRELAEWAELMDYRQTCNDMRMQW